MNPKDFLNFLLYGRNAGLKVSDIENAARRNPFATFLPYRAYDEEMGSFINQDESVGFVWECRPMIFTGEDAGKSVEALIRGSNLPDDSVLSFTLHADPFVERHIDIMNKIRVRKDEVIAHCTQTFSEYLREGTKGLYNVSRIPLRNFRILVSLKLPIDCKEVERGGLLEIRNQFEESLVGLGLQMSDKGVLRYSPGDLLDWTRRIFNDDNPLGYAQWDENIPLNKQIIRSDCPVSDHGTHLHVGNKVWRCMTPKVHSSRVSFHLYNILFGGFMGGGDDNSQIRSPFLYTLTIYYKDMKKKLHTKCNMVLQQKGVGSFAPSLARKQEEYQAATGMIDRGINFMRATEMFWVYDKDYLTATDSLARARRIWDANSFVMQIDRGILKVLFIASLPLGLYPNKGKTLDLLERDFTVDTEALTPCVPLQGDYAGAGLPKSILIGRKGQLACLDFWAKGSPNFNALILAASGGGKSFLMNDIVVGNYACGSNIRILDIGRSYKKLVKLLGAKFLDFHPNHPVSLNPFTFIVHPESELQSIVDIISLMAYSSTPDKSVSTIEKNLIRDAVRWAWATGHNKADTGLVYEFLSKFPHIRPAGSGNSQNLPPTEEEKQARGLLYTDEIIKASKHLAFQIQEFTPKGMFGGFFTGDASFNIRDDSVVVTELQELVGQAELYRVVTGLITNAYLQDSMHSTAKGGTLFLYDEAWQYLRDDTGGAGGLLAPMLERLARTARKYNSGLAVVSQSVLDIDSFGASGQALWGNTAYKIFLQSPDLQSPRAQEQLGYNDFLMRLLRSLESKPPYYSEMFIDSPFGKGVARLAQDNYTYFVNTSKREEFEEIESLVARGMSYHDAIKAMIPKRINELFKEVKVSA